MVLLNLTKEEAKLLFELLPIDPDFEGEKTHIIYDGLHRKVSNAKW